MGRRSAFLQLLLVCQLANGQSTVGTSSINIDLLISVLGQFTLSTDTASAITTLATEQSVLSTQSGSEVPTTAASAATASDSPAVSSTMTTQPSGFLTVLTTDPAFTENRWITTENEGHTTVLPVIVGCPGCGPDGSMILKHMPEIPQVEFSFISRLKVWFPCIPILQQCTTPPGSEPKAENSPTSAKGTVTKAQASTISSCLHETHVITNAVASCAVQTSSGTIATTCFATSTSMVTETGCSLAVAATTTSELCTLTSPSVTWDGTETMPPFTPDWGAVAPRYSAKYSPGYTTQSTDSGNEVSAPPSQAGALSDLPTLPPVSYCTEVLDNGRNVLHTKTDSICTYRTVLPTTSSLTQSASQDVQPGPTQIVDSGILACNDKGPSTNLLRPLDLYDNTAATSWFCRNMTVNDPPIIFEPGSSTAKVGTWVSGCLNCAEEDISFVGGNPGNVVTVSAMWGALDDSTCPTLDFSLEGNEVAESLCRERFGTIVRECELPDKVGTSKGGSFFRDCITWEFHSWSN